MSKLLGFSSFTSLSNWSVSHLLENQFQYNKNYPLEKIGNFLKRNKTQVVLKDSVEYKRVTIKLYNKGVLLRDTELGKNIKTKKQFLVKKGQFLLSKIDARNGAFGIATKEVDEAIITADFFAYDIDTTKIEPYFLVLMTTTKKFQQFAQSASSGTTGRQRIDEKKFLDVKIPLPSLKEQKRIVKNYQNKMDLAILQEEEVGNKEKEIEIYLYEELGVEIVENNEVTNELLSFRRFKDIKEWDIKSLNFNNRILFKKTNTMRLSEVIKLQSGDFLPKSKQIKGKYIVYGGNGKNGVHNQFNKKGKRILIGRVGEYCGNIHLVDGEYWVTDNSFYSDIIYDKINIIYLSMVLKLVKLNQYKNIAGQPSLSQKNIKNINLPIPSLKIQDKIVEHCNIIVEKIKALKEQSLLNKKLALKEFEKEIFNET